MTRVEIDSTVKMMTEKIEAAIAERTAFMDAHMSQCSRFQIGDPVYDEHGSKLGTVMNLYRPWRDRDPLYDTSMDVSVQYKMEGHENFFDNSSRQLDMVFTEKEKGSRHG